MFYSTHTQAKNKSRCRHIGLVKTNQQPQNSKRRHNDISPLRGNATPQPLLFPDNVFRSVCLTSEAMHIAQFVACLKKKK